MAFKISKSITILERTPTVLYTLLNNLPTEWVMENEGKSTWNAYEVVAHLIHGEKTDWMVRATQILTESTDVLFEPFDRFAHLKVKPQLPLNNLLLEFKTLRATNISTLKKYQLNLNTLQRTGTHPDFGTVTLQELIAAWVVHDLGHLAQISRTMAKHYTHFVGPWKAYMGVLNK